MRGVVTYIPTLVFPEGERNDFLPGIGSEGNNISVITRFFLDTPPPKGQYLVNSNDAN